MKTLPDEVIASSLEAELAGPLKVDFCLAARTALQNVQQELATKEVEQWVRSELERTAFWEQVDILGENNERRGQTGTQETGTKAECFIG